MSVLRKEKMNILSAGFHGESSLPPIAVKLSLGDISNRSHLDEDDGLYINYGNQESAYPYRYQDMYDRELQPTEYESIVLENPYLKAVFLPELGGKLWSLVDKVRDKELLFQNDVVRPCNLAVRNAWTSGGIEWNCGFKGHGPYTCSLINTAETKLEDGTPVLRFYYFERIRCVVVQMDFFLPEESELLYSRVRITNPNDEVVPMYWWSNVAVVQKEGDRVIVPAWQSYTVNSESEVMKIDIPEYNGLDVTYPLRNITAIDYFWTTEHDTRHYIAQLDQNGYGLCQTSTKRLVGRKLFVWGDSQGGSKWMNFLTADDKSGAYDEIQCGLAHTQYECLPMPPNTVWEWLEGYGAMQARPDQIHGQWGNARKEVESILADKISESDLEQLLANTRKMALTPAKVLLSMEDGWAALELYRREKTGRDLKNGHLDFGTVGTAQQVWISLLEQGTVGVQDDNEAPLSYMRQKEWMALLQEALCGKDKDNWYAYYLLGTAYIAEECYEEAKQLLEESLARKDTAWGNYGLAVYYKKTGNQALENRYMLRAYQLRKGDISLAKEVFRSLYENNEAELTINLFEQESRSVRENKRCLLYYAYALARAGRTKEAEEILCGKDGNTYLVVPDIREEELIVTELWFLIQEQQGKSPKEAGQPPKDLDFRMHAMRDEWL